MSKPVAGDKTTEFRPSVNGDPHIYVPVALPASQLFFLDKSSRLVLLNIVCHHLLRPLAIWTNGRARGPHFRGLLGRMVDSLRAIITLRVRAKRIAPNWQIDRAILLGPASMLPTQAAARGANIAILAGRGHLLSPSCPIIAT